MKYHRKPLSDILRSPKTVFTFKDVSIIWENPDRKSVISGVNYYVGSGQIYRVRRGIYAKDENYSRDELATRIYTPSYISFETVLGREGISFGYYNQIFVASYLTREITIDNQVYCFRKIKGPILANPLGIENVNETSIATTERAFLDMLYINPDYHCDSLPRTTNAPYVKGQHPNPEPPYGWFGTKSHVRKSVVRGLSSIDWDKLFEILPLYQNKRMIKIINKWYKQETNNT